MARKSKRDQGVDQGKNGLGIGMRIPEATANGAVGTTKIFQNGRRNIWAKAVEPSTLPEPITVRTKKRYGNISQNTHSR